MWKNVVQHFTSKSGDIDSYAKAMRKGAELGVRHFLLAIEKFLNEIQFDVVSKNFVMR